LGAKRILVVGVCRRHDNVFQLSTDEADKLEIFFTQLLAAQLFLSDGLQPVAHARQVLQAGGIKLVQQAAAAQAVQRHAAEGR